MFPAFPPLFPALLAALPTGPGAAALVAAASIAYVLTQRELALRVRVS